MNAATQARFVPIQLTQATKTPLRRLRQVGKSSLWIKDETQQISGAFKFRGSMSFLSRQAVPTGVVTTASTGNHATGLSLAAREFGYEARIFVPEATPEAKQSRIREAGGKITLVKGDYEMALAQATQLAGSGAATLVPSYDHPDIVAGNRGIFSEIQSTLRQAPTRIYAPIGGGGVISGAILEMAGTNAQIIGVEFDEFARTHAIVSKKIGEIAPPARPAPASVEGIAIRSLGGHTSSIIGAAQNLKLAAVSAEQMAKACRLIWQQMGIKAELGACATVAAALADGDQPGTTVCVVTGGNIGGDVFNAIQNNDNI
ncbi:pyridoxal-phosphate dependent enzyme [Roseovarius bejariae]|nr:pyridoxal-phosphate dependent enzyme [Roseovarius bejariae]